LTNVANYDARFTIVDVPTPDNGAPIITTQGITLGGNSRVMTLQYIGDVAGVQQYDKKYFNYLRGKFVEFGIDRGKLLRLLGGGEYYILVRIIDVPISQCATYNNTFNTNFTQEVDLIQKSVSYARQLGQDGIERIGNLFAENDTDYSDMVNDSSIRRQLVKILEDYNVITSQNKNQWLSYNNEFTDIGKLQLRNILLGAVLPDKRYIETAKNYSDRLLKTVPQLIAIESLPKEYHISDYIIEVVKAESARRASGMDKKDFLNQTNFDAPELSQQSQLIWNALDSGINTWRKWVNKYLHIAKDESYRNSNDDMFGTKPLNQTEILEKLNSSSLSDGDDFVPNSCPPVYQDGTRCITDDCIRQLDECIENEQPTKWKNWDGATNNYTAARLQLHQKIIDDFTKNKQCEPASQQPVAILTGGASGSGKSTLLKQYVPNIQDYVIIDIDKMREYLPEYKGWNANATQEEVKDIYNKLFDTLGNPCRYNIIVDGTMNKAKSYKPILDKLRKLGYKVLIMYVKVTKEQSIQRAMNRYVKSGRYVPKFVIDEIFMNGTAAFDELKENSDGYILIDNSGAKPVVESQTTNTLGDSKYIVSNYEELISDYKRVINRVKKDNKIIDIQDDYETYGGHQHSRTTRSFYSSFEPVRYSEDFINIRISDHIGRINPKEYDIYIVYENEKYPVISPEELYQKLQKLINKKRGIRVRKNNSGAKPVVESQTTDTLGDSKNSEHQTDTENNISSWQSVSKKTGKPMYYAQGHNHYDTGVKGAFTTRQEAINTVLRQRTNSNSNYIKAVNTEKEYAEYLPLYLQTIEQFKTDNNIPKYTGYGNGHKAITTKSYYSDIFWNGERNPIKIRISDHYGNEAANTYDVQIVFGSEKHPAITPEELYNRLQTILQERISR
jgi:predicted ABC-type ATPase